MAPKWRQHDERRTAPPSRRDDGYTLTELLVAMALMGTVVLAIVGGMWAVVRASSMNEDRAKVQAIIGGAGDALTNYAHVKCPEPDEDRLNTYLGLVQSAADAVGWPRDTVQITAYRYFHPETATWEEDYSFQSRSCNDAIFLSRERTMQKITITVTAPRSGYSQSIDIVKADIRPQEVRDVTAPTGS